MSRMSRRAFLGFRFSEEDAGTRDVPGGVPGNAPAPEFSPAMLRAEAERLGLDPDRIGAGERASAVMRAMSARAPEGAGRTG
ncbi:MAG: apoptosis regulator Bcl-2 [Bilophila wadsworthia]